MNVELALENIFSFLISKFFGQDVGDKLQFRSDLILNDPHWTQDTSQSNLLCAGSSPALGTIFTSNAFELS